MNNLIGGAMIFATGFVGYLVLAGGNLEAQTRDCLETHSRQYLGGQDHVYLTEVIGEEIWRSYPDGTATRFVKYRVQGSNDVKTATCRW
ncbi:hypothetical protein [Jannaschia marina]|uniref:hypothetical protein n=1 Tax=Jannaschia marina TaxID=2741674 RepID=UPI0015C711FC|nr:hypothetical protein [Jannaschia marina]